MNSLPTDLLSGDPEVLGFDPVMLREKYEHERNRRITEKGSAQYERAEAVLDEGEKDPYTPFVPRDAITENVTVLVVGGGYGGLLTSVYLKKEGITDIRIVEGGGDFGGTWYWNRYPNAQCDTEAYIYLPLLEETGYMPTRNYAYADEIFGHVQRIARHFDLYRHALFHTEVTGATWDEERAGWLVETNRGDRIFARHLALSSGGLTTRPKVPNVPGVEKFKGKMFHTSRWDYEYTGGDMKGNLSKLADKRVGIVGTGATAVQCVVPLSQSAKELYVFQRTPSSIGYRNNAETDPEWAKSLTPGWQQRRAEDFLAGVEGKPYHETFVGDGWIDILSSASRAVKSLMDSGIVLSGEERGRVSENADFRTMERLRKRIDDTVKDPATAELLKPWFRPLCKRPCFHDEYLDCFNQPNVHLVDAANGGIQALDETGMFVDGKHYELDCLIWATGFEATSSFGHKGSLDLLGRGGQSLIDKWAAGYVTMFGFTTAGFPNCYFVTRTQSPLPQNIPTFIEESAKHTAYLIGKAEHSGIRVLDTQPEGEAMWQQEMAASSKDTFRFHSQCTPGWFNNEGHLTKSDQSFFAGLYGGGTIRFFDIVRAWRAEDRLEFLAPEYSEGALAEAGQSPGA